MTLRCRRPILSIQQVISLSLLLGLNAVGSAVLAQSDAPELPPAPTLNRSGAERPDAEFRSPMRKNGASATRGSSKTISQAPPGFDAPPEGPPPGGPDMGGPGGPEFEMGGPDGEGPPMGRRRQQGQNGPGGPGGRMGRRMGPDGGQFGQGGMRQRRGPGGMEGAFGALGGHRQLDLTSLNLTEQQKQRVKQIRTATKERAREARRLVMTKQVALRGMLFSATATDAQIRASRKELRSAQDQMDELNLDDLLQIRGVLTAQQKQRLPELAPPPPGGFGPRGNATVGQRTRMRQPE